MSRAGRSFFYGPSKRLNSCCSLRASKHSWQSASASGADVVAWLSWIHGVSCCACCAALPYSICTVMVAGRMFAAPVRCGNCWRQACSRARAAGGASAGSKAHKICQGVLNVAVLSGGGAVGVGQSVLACRPCRRTRACPASRSTCAQCSGQAHSSMRGAAAVPAISGA